MAPKNNRVFIKNKDLRIPPQNLDAEKALLGAIMLRADALSEMADFLDPKAFYAEKHRLIYEVMTDLFARHEPIDLISVSGLAQARGLLEQVGGVAYLSELVAGVPASVNVFHYAEIVQKKHLLRKMIEAADVISELGYTEDEEIEILLDQAEKEIHDVTGSQKGKKFAHIKEMLAEAWERIEKLHKHDGGLRGVSTGFVDLDNKLAGLQKSDLIILAARPSMGKTSFALDIARNAAVKDQVPTLIFSLEMSRHQLVDRMIVAESKVDSWKYRRGRLSLEDDFSSLHQAMDTLTKSPIFVDDQPAATITRMRSISRRIRSEHGLGLVIIDYLQLMATNQRYDSMVNQVTEISRSLKQLARDMEVPVLALSQLSRAVESRGGRPRLSDLRDSGSIEQDADVVMFIHSEDRYKETSERPNVVEILIEKHRNGPTGKVDLYFDDKKTSFISLDTATGFNEFKTVPSEASF